MLFAINYSHQAAALCAENRLEVDRFKYTDWPDMIAEAQELRQVAVHFTLKAGRGKRKKVNWEKIARIAEQTGTRYINLHLEPRPEVVNLTLALETARAHGLLAPTSSAPA